MPWDIRRNIDGCDGIAVVKRGTTKVVGCHSSVEAAQKQLAALYAAEPEAYAKSLSDSDLRKAHNVTHGKDLTGANVTLHHVIAQEMRERGLAHDKVECALHKAVVLKSELVLEQAKAEAMLKGQPTSTTVHVPTIMGGKKKKKKRIETDEELDTEDE